MKDLANALSGAGFNIKREDDYTLVVLHPWRNDEEFKESLAANRKTTSIAMKFKPMSISAEDQFKRTVIKL